MPPMVLLIKVEIVSGNGEWQETYKGMLCGSWGFGCRIKEGRMQLQDCLLIRPGMTGRVGGEW